MRAAKTERRMRRIEKSSPEIELTEWVTGNEGIGSECRLSFRKPAREFDIGFDIDAGDG